MMALRARSRLVPWVLLAGLVMSGCAAAPAVENETAKAVSKRIDPWENWNRKVYAFNDKLDTAVLKPVATTYTKVVPQPVRQGVSNFFGNVADAWSAINNFLQGKVSNGLQDVMRVGTNTIFGLAGVFDVASEFGVDRQNEDFGQTLGRWGMAPGPYIVWPLLGPSTVRESLALPLDRSVSPALAINDTGGRYAVVGLQLINDRAALLGASNLLNDIALDRYVFVRDAYMQRRRSLVYDGNVPELDSYYDASPAAGEAKTPDANAPAAAAPAASAASQPSF